MPPRYKFYREHKYVSFAVSEVERLIAKTDFSEQEAVQKLATSFEEVVSMLSSHAIYEDARLHTLLKAKQSNAFEHAEKDHADYERLIEELRRALEQIIQESDRDLRQEMGYRFYLNFRYFVGINLLHLHEEETKILPELQRLYSDEELKRVERETYQMMSVEELQEMLHVLFPHMNTSDKEAFLADIQEAAPEKYSQLMCK